jgi:D-alanine-D-alanine ligase
MSRVALIFGGRSVEHAVSIHSARTVAAALEAAGQTVIPLGVAQDGTWVDEETSRRALAGELHQLAPTGGTALASLARLLESQAEVIFPVVHGSWGEDGCLQGLAETVDLPYVGCGVAASAVAMDKVLAKGALRRAGIPVVDGVSFPRRQFEHQREICLEKAARLGFPSFVKPAAGGSSVGVRKAGDAAQLEAAVDFAFRFDESVLVEKAVRGRELECAVLGHGDPEASVVGEIVAGREFYDYEDKYLVEGARLLAPAELSPAPAARVRALAVEAFVAIGGSGMARVDFFLEGEETLFVNEINTVPGFTAISMYPRLWELTGVPRPELVSRLIQHACERHAERHRLDAGIKEWLAALAG